MQNPPTKTAQCLAVQRIDKAVVKCILILAAFDIGSPMAVMASEGEAAGWGIWETVGRVFNLALVVGVLVYVLRKPLGLFFEERRQNIRKSLEEAQRARLEAEQKLAEMQQKMLALDGELAAIREQAQREAADERRRSREQAEQDAERITATACREAEALVRAATVELRGQAARLAVELAERKIESELAADVEGRLVKKFTEQLGKPR